MEMSCLLTFTVLMYAIPKKNNWGQGLTLDNRMEKGIGLRTELFRTGVMQLIGLLSCLSYWVH